MPYRLNALTALAIIFCLIIIQAGCFPLHAFQGSRPEPGEMIYRAFVSEQMDLWGKAMEILDKEYKLTGNTHVLYELILARYGFIGYNLGIGNEKVATAQIELAEMQIGDLAANPQYESSAQAIQAALFAYRIAMAPWRALFWGRRSMNLINSAIATDPNNPQAWIEHGNAMFYAPGALGGSKQEAIKSYGKAVSLMEANMTDKHRWLYLNTLVALAKSYLETGNRQMAIRTYRKALEFEPEFTWVRDRLLPELLKE
jgi:tetratricopeptide (TPR) repeat protein